MQHFEIATIGSGKTVHLIASGEAACGIRGMLHTDVLAEQAHWDCRRCDRTLSDSVRAEALQQIQAAYALANLDAEADEPIELTDEQADDLQERVDARAEASIKREIAQRELRKSLVKEYKLSWPMQRDLALSYQTALGSKDSLPEGQDLLIVCHDGMTSKGLRARGLMGEGGRNGWATDEGLALAQVMYDTEDLA